MKKGNRRILKCDKYGFTLNYKVLFKLLNGQR